MKTKLLKKRKKKNMGGLDKNPYVNKNNANYIYS